MASRSKSFIRFPNAAYRPFIRQLRDNLQRRGILRHHRRFYSQLSFSTSPRLSFSCLSRQAVKLPPRQAVVLQNIRTPPFPVGKGEVRILPYRGRQHSIGSAGFHRQVASRHQDKVFNPIHGKVRYCHHPDYYGSNHNIKISAPAAPISNQLRRFIVRCGGRAVSRLSAIVVRSIPFRSAPSVFRSEESMPLPCNRAVALFHGCEEDTSSEADKSSIHPMKVQAPEPRHGVSDTHSFSTSSQRFSTPFHAPQFHGFARPLYRTMKHLRTAA